MGCKLLDSLPENDTQPLPWHGGFSSNGAAPAARTGPAQGTRAEAAALRAQVEEIRTAAEQQVRAAFEQGFLQGEGAARQKLESEYRAAAERLGAAIAEAAGSRGEAMRRAESDTVRLAIEIARRVLHRELSVDAGALEGLVKAALEKLKEQEILRVRAHPDLVKLLGESIGRTGRGQTVEIVPDPARPPGGIIFEISRGCLDASLDTQLREIERGLVDQLRTR